MSTVVGHALAGALASACCGRAVDPGRRRRLAALAGATALLPDVDVVLRHVGVGPLAGIHHRGLSHSLLFAVGVAAAMTALARWWLRGFAGRLFVVFLLAGLSHLLLDFLMGAGPPVQPFAPLSDRGFLAPARLVPIAYYATTTAGYRSMPYWIANALAASLEIVMIAPLFHVFAPGRPARARAAAACVAATGAVVTFAMFNT